MLLHPVLEIKLARIVRTRTVVLVFSRVEKVLGKVFIFTAAFQKY